MLSYGARVLGLLLFAVGLVSLTADGISSIAADGLVLTPLSDSIGLIAPDAVDRLRTLAVRVAGPAAWDNWGPVVLSWPTFAVSGCAGVFLMLAGARRPPKRPA